MSTAAPALPALPWLPGLAGIDRRRIDIVIGDKRYEGETLESRRRLLVLHQAGSGSARRDGDTLHIAVAPDDADWALALAAAFADPERPAAADPASQALLALAARVGASPASVLIEGATGTGKEGLARLVHAASPRRGQAFVAVNCAALARLAQDSDRLDDTAISPALVRRIIRLRRDRDRHFPADLFADPAWDMLLDLAAARMEAADVAVSSLCVAAAVPTTTALRWVRSLGEAGIFVRRTDPADARRVFITLSDEAFAAVTAWLRRFAAAFALR
ncbi:MAG: sigma 54-interacting transcriptional regulator [Sphingomonadales bacterium]|jgi:hypothetical protein